MRAQILDSFADVDTFATPAAVEVKAANLRPGMVLLDPELGTPAAGLDHKLRAARNSGNVSWFVADLDNGGWRELHLRPSLVVKVAAA
ncbi:hypothetical protein FGG30_gp092 [Mycobacterium phage Pixie]|uniref:Uncharacterized protein n=2 Tax=Keshuvirus pixie TaxID=1034114 RepID=G1D501_9CAUD|nr:hypothetical protein FGG30_gp092 [Mycobacterium phage Pixie]AEK09902.1 hypothetical protein PBI_PIXIE_92 [Mycobacterium phage Pixie]AOT23828.1 hypothetical protein SEA_TBOND007_89 [Mycobacterium phage TBond007]